ncbi:MAG: hypothetical protein US42_C0002G0024 [Candidatus Magasanikbacteria bacterium GW2011_GWC2_37_14]|uniref:ParB/Sulfiredoxin domain-containing protein n=1 Tax=Candidatus Magasanikbacteria bacterium GW2011_GWC2_37_14 TaxID=1619046 RepID=A0A0G0IV74_9BACT|nr:MAG: hypothetical protein US42_C0002G0024 [Candidatus Magasanikbacteria bacterium GW2011_GWC2_37_14]
MKNNYDWESVGLDFGNWDEEKIWALNLTVVEIDINELLWHFDAPWWPNDTDERWTVTPWDVLNKTVDSKKQQDITDQVDLSYPIDIFKNKGKWLILDGIHRLVKSYKQGLKKVKVHIIPPERLPEILSGLPIELPNS